MNWYKLAELTVTPREFQAMSYEGKKALAQNTSISPQTQQLFFTEEYPSNISVLQTLAKNRSISPETQKLFFTVKYDYKNHVLWWLAANTSITLEVQRLFFTEDYGGKTLILSYLEVNPSFLKGLTPKEMREFTKTNKLTVYSKRFNESRLKFYRLRY